MAQPRNPKSLRSIIASLLLACFSKGSHGPTAEVVAKVPTYKNGNLKVRKPKLDVERTKTHGYNDNTLKVQIAQVRLALLAKVGVELPFEVKGRMSEEQKMILDKKLNNPEVKSLARRLRKEYAKAA